MGQTKITSNDISSSVATTPATSGYALIADGSGNTSWLSVADIDTSTPPGGANTNIQYNSSSTFAGSSKFTWDDINQSLSINNGSAAFNLSCALSAGTGNVQIGDSLLQATNKSMHFTTGTSGPTLAIIHTNASDYVGIGNNASNPQYPLDVGGDVNVASGNVYRINGTILADGTIGQLSYFSSANTLVSNPDMSFDGTNITFVASATNTFAVNGGDISVTSGAALGVNGNGGHASLAGGNGYVTGGKVSLTAGNSTSSGGAGGDISISSGSDVGSGSGGSGSITLNTPMSTAGNGGSINLICTPVTNEPGPAFTGGFGGSINLGAGAGDAGGGNIYATGGQSGRNGGVVTITGGKGDLNGGNVSLVGGRGGLLAGDVSLTGADMVLSVAPYAGNVNLTGGAGIASGATGGSINIKSGVGVVNPGVITFSIGAAEKARFDITGFLGIGTNVPSSLLTVAGAIESTSSGFKFPDTTVQTTAISSSVVTKTSAYLAAVADNVILCDATSAAFAVTLPLASARTGQFFNIKKIDSSVNTVTITPSGGNTIDGAANIIITLQYQSYEVVSDGTNWWVI